MDAVQAATAVGAVCGAIIAVGTVTIAIGRPLRRLAEDWERVREDLYGEPARPGRPRVAGVVERVADLEPRLAKVEAAHDNHLVAHGFAAQLNPP